MSAPVKLPLAVRKDIRDNFENKKEELVKKIRDILNEEYKLEVDFPTIYTFAESDYEKERPGKIAYEVIDDFTRRLKEQTDDGKKKAAVEGFNEGVSSKTITIVIDKDTKSYSSCRVKDGVFEIMFKPGGFGTNSGSATEYMFKEIDEATSKSNPKALPMIAKIGIQKKFEDEKEKLEAKIKDELDDQGTLSLKADFPAIWAKIIDVHDALPKREKSEVDLENCSRNMGYYTYEYFDGLHRYMKSKFNGDEMVIEGFLESVEKKEVVFEMRDKLEKGYNGFEIKDGQLIIFTIPKYFGTNVGDAFNGLLEAL